MDIQEKMFVRVNSIFVAVILSRFHNPFILKQIVPKYVYNDMKIGGHNVSKSCICQFPYAIPVYFQIVAGSKIS
jgi:hypothetical protein